MAKENEFIDAVGESWVCRFNTPALLDAGRDLNVTPALLETPEQINIGIMGRLVWYAVRNLANARGVSKKQFEEERMTLAVLPMPFAPHLPLWQWHFQMILRRNNSPNALGGRRRERHTQEWRDL